MTQFINFYNVLISCTQRNICLWISNDSRDFIRSNAVKAFISFCRDFIKCWKFIFFWEKNYCGGTYAFSVRLFFIRSAFVFMAFIFLRLNFNTTQTERQNNTEDEKKLSFWASSAVVEMCGWFLSLVVSSFSLRGSIWNGIRHTSIFLRIQWNNSKNLF